MADFHILNGIPIWMRIGNIGNSKLQLRRVDNRHRLRHTNKLGMFTNIRTKRHEQNPLTLNSEVFKKIK